MGWLGGMWPPTAPAWNWIDRTGQRYGRLVVLEPTYRGSGKWLCRCDCGVEVTRSWTTLRDAKVPSCNCYKRERLRTLPPPSGPAHHRWKGGNPTRREDALGRSKYRAWQRAVRSAAGGRCACCGITPSDPQLLECHHINSLDVHPDQALDVANGAALYRPCHQSFHNEYGYGGNTRAQYEAWLGVRFPPVR